MYDANVPAPVLIGLLAMGAVAAARSIRDRVAAKALQPVRVASSRRRTRRSR